VSEEHMGPRMASILRWQRTCDAWDDWSGSPFADGWVARFGVASDGLMAAVAPGGQWRVAGDGENVSGVERTTDEAFAACERIATRWAERRTTFPRTEEDLRRLLNELHHLRGQVTELQAGNTKLVEERRELAARVVGLEGGAFAGKVMAESIKRQIGQDDPAYTIRRHVNAERAAIEEHLTKMANDERRRKADARALISARRASRVLANALDSASVWVRERRGTPGAS
jgi:chromosome segregation ATPase